MGLLAAIAFHKYAFYSCADWCRAVDPTPNKAIGNCLSYRVMLEPSAADELLPMLASVGLVQRGVCGAHDLSPGYLLRMACWQI